MGTHFLFKTRREGSSWKMKYELFLGRKIQRILENTELMYVLF